MSKTTHSTRLLSTSLAAFAWFALLLQLPLSVQTGLQNGKGLFGALLVYLGYFTIWTNLFIALVATAGAQQERGRWATFLYRPSIVGCATAAIVLVAVVYHWALRQIWSPQGAQWLADNLLHYAVPALAILHWGCYRPERALNVWAPLTWCLYPAAYFAYALLLGACLGSYPYPFIDAQALGYAQVLRNAGGLTLGFTLIAYAVWASKRWTQ